jgi:probable phosphoglycerate mutase
VTAPAAARRVLLVRHGRTGWNAERRFQGQLDIPLDEVGEAQAGRLAGLLARVPVAAVVSSDLSRAAATARIVAQECGVALALDERLREIYLGDWQGISADEAELRYPHEHAAWQAGEDVRRGGGETYAEVAVRAVAAVEAVVAEAPGEGLILVVTHGGTIRAVAGALTGLPSERWGVLGPVGNVRWSTLVHASAERGWRLAQHNAGDLDGIA